VLSLTDRHGEAVELVCDEIEQRPDVYRAVYTTLGDLRQQLTLACGALLTGDASHRGALVVSEFLRGLPNPS
jgi:hypothetical protein